MIGVQRENTIHCALQHRIDHVILRRNGKHHTQEVTGIRQIVARIDERFANRIFIRHRHQGWNFCDQAMSRNFATFCATIVRRIKRTHCAHRCGQHRHRMRITAKATEKRLHLLMDHRVVHDVLFNELIFLRLIRQLAIEQQIGYFQILAFFSQLLDRVTTIQQLTFITINKRND